MIGRPLRIEWDEDDSPAALKEAYHSQRDVSVRTRVSGGVIMYLVGGSIAADGVEAHRLCPLKCQGKMSSR